MLIPEVYKECTPLSESDCFVVFERRKSYFSFPVHIHPECELNFVSNAKGAHRIVGDSYETIEDNDLVLIANPKLRHAWMDGDNTSKDIYEITIQFLPSLIEQYLSKNQFQSINRLFKDAYQGVCFSQETIGRVRPLLEAVTSEKDGFYSVMKLMALLHELSKSEGYRELSTLETPEDNRNIQLLKRLHDYTTKHMSEKVRISDVAAELNMSRSTFARFLNTHIQMNFSDYMLDRRIKTAVVKLKAGFSNHLVSDQCGFNSLSYFYRVFKNTMGVNPTEFKNKCRRQQRVV